jgi:hypothetical protein
VAQPFSPGDFLVIQLESGYGLLRLLAVEDREGNKVWHVRAYEDFFPDVEAAEAALVHPGLLHVGISHMALTDRAFERTPAAVLGNRQIVDEELTDYKRWHESGDGRVHDRSILQMLGIR